MLYSLPSCLLDHCSNITSFRAEGKSLLGVLVHFPVVAVVSYRHNFWSTLSSIWSQMWCYGSLPLLHEIVELLQRGSGLHRGCISASSLWWLVFPLESNWSGGYILKVNIISAFQIRSLLKCHICSLSMLRSVTPSPTDFSGAFKLQ